jgi:uncharacterized phage-associated protein
MCATLRLAAAGHIGNKALLLSLHEPCVVICMATLAQSSPSTLQEVVTLWQSVSALPTDNNTLARVTQNVHELEIDAAAIEQLPTLAQWLAAFYLRCSGQFAKAAAWYVRVAPVISTLLEEDEGVANDWELLDNFSWATTLKHFVDLAAEGPDGVQTMLEARQRVREKRAREEARHGRSSSVPASAIGGAAGAGRASRVHESSSASFSGRAPMETAAVTSGNAEVAGQATTAQAGSRTTVVAATSASAADTEPPAKRQRVEPAIRGAAPPPTAVSGVPSTKCLEYVRFKYATTYCRGGRPLPTNFHFIVQKLLYFADCYWAATCGTTLLDEAPEAWENGPVYRGAYRHFQSLVEARASMRLLSPAVSSAIPEEVQLLLDNLVDAAPIGTHDAQALVDLAHTETLWRASSKNEVISHDRMLAFMQRHGNDHPVVLALSQRKPLPVANAARLVRMDRTEEACDGGAGAASPAIGAGQDFEGGAL